MLITLIRLLVIGAGFTIQSFIWISWYRFLINKFFFITPLYMIIGVLLALGMIKNSSNYSYSLPWIIILLLFPLMGAILYVILDSKRKSSKRLKQIVKKEAESKTYLKDENTLPPQYRNRSDIRYITEYAGFPGSTKNSIRYFPLGDDAFPVILDALKKAEKFIFFEYFIVSRGEMWDSILEILKEKAQKGVEVRVMYDDIGSLLTLDKTYPLTLEKMGIKCVAFNPVNPILDVIINNRDHRKILVIDGKTAFSGGINIADEYINRKEKFGHWKDNCIQIKGEAVWSYTVMFLSLWNVFRKEDEDFTVFRSDSAAQDLKDNGLLIPYGLSPLNDDLLGENIYLNIINRAEEYVYIFTPYLIIDTDMINAMILAAKRGVDVKIIIPGIPDKKIVYTLSQSYVELLVKGGVHVYKYTPGFVHGKVFVSDDHTAVIGTINLDYRSLYLHFECGCFAEDADVISDVKNDLQKTLDSCTEIKKENISTNFFLSIWQAFLRLVAPLM